MLCRSNSYSLFDYLGIKLVLKSYRPTNSNKITIDKRNYSDKNLIYLKDPSEKHGWTSVVDHLNNRNECLSSFQLNFHDLPDMACSKQKTTVSITSNSKMWIYQEIKVICRIKRQLYVWWHEMRKNYQWRL